MNKLAIALSAALAIGASFSASAQSGTITFNGQITATTCQVTWPGSTGTATDPIVTLPTVPTTALSGAEGKTAGKTPIALTIGADGTCAASVAAIELNPNRDANQANGYLDNELTSGNAVGVQVALRDASDNPILIDTPWRSAEVAIGATGARIDFAAEYRASAASVDPGQVSASVGYTIDYK